MARSDLAQASLVGASGEYLLSSQMLLLHSPHLVLVLVLFFSHCCFFHLHVSLVHDLLPLLGIHTLKVVWFDSVGSKSGNFSLWVLSHKVVIVGMIDIGLSLELFVGTLSIVSVALLLSHLSICILHRFLHVDACLDVLILSFLKQFTEVSLLCVMSCLVVFLLLCIELFFTDLLVDEISLL